MMRLFSKAALAAALILAAAPLYAAEGLAPNFQVLSVTPGLGSRLRSRCTIPVAVEVQVVHTPVSGRMIVTSSFGTESVPEYVLPFDVSPGASYLFTLYPFCQSTGERFTLTIEDKSGRRLRPAEELSMRQPDENEGYCFIAAIGSEGIPGLALQERKEKTLGVSCAPVPLELVPQRACGWDSADVVIWAHPDPAGMSPAQQNALSEWVLGGGRLILAVGDSWEAVNKTFLRGFLPRLLSGAATTKELARLAAYGEAPFDADAEMLIAALEGESASAQILADVKPLVLKRRHGFGEVVFLAFDPTKRPFARWTGNARFWQKLLKLDLPEGQVLYAGQGDHGSLRDSLSAALNDFPEVRPISFGFVVLFLVTYVILIGPVDYFVLRRIKHLEWTWFTFPAIALAATLVAFWTISVSRKARIYVNQLSVADWSADGAFQRSLDMAVLLSPVHHRYNVSFSGSPRNLYLVESFRYDMAMGATLTSSRFTMLDVSDKGMTARQILIPVWSARTFAGEERSSKSVEPPLSVSLFEENGVLSGSVTNNGLSNLSNVAVVHRTGVYVLPPAPLKPGDTWQVSPRGRVAFDRWASQAAEAWSHSRQGMRRSRTLAGEAARCATVALDPRYFPAQSWAYSASEGSAAAFDLPAEWSLRSNIDDGQAVVLGFAQGTGTPLDIGEGGALRWETTCYRVCAQVL